MTESAHEQDAAEQSPDRRPFYLTRNNGFGAAQSHDDYLHPTVNATVDDDSLTETQYFGLEIPEHRIHMACYLLYRVNLHTVMGGVWAWQGTQRQMQCDLFDMHGWMHDRVLANDLHNYRLVNGYGVQVVEPMRKHRITYADVGHNNSVDLEATAVNPAIMFGDGRHFEQVMRIRGELVLRGRRYDVDSFNVRDRSWGKPRPEMSMPLPPVGWMTGVFSDSFSFNCTAFDDHRLMPEWGGKFAIPEDKLVNSGWIYRAGELSMVTHCIKRTQRDPVSLYPTHIEMELRDDKNRTYRISGEILCSSDWYVNPSMRWVNVSVRWECDGQIAVGEEQEAHWADFMRAFVR